MKIVQNVVNNRYLISVYSIGSIFNPKRMMFRFPVEAESEEAARQKAIVMLSYCPEVIEESAKIEVRLISSSSDIT